MSSVDQLSTSNRLANTFSVMDHEQPSTNGLERTLGLKDLTLLIIGTVIGSGIFIVPGAYCDRRMAASRWRCWSGSWAEFFRCSAL